MTANENTDRVERPREEGTCRIRQRLEIAGRVQGVGFRPFVFRLAGELGLCGFVGNNERGVFIEAEGPGRALGSFAARLRDELPPLARISSLDIRDLPTRGDQTFRIAPSEAGADQQAEITPDAATCADCLAEMNDPRDRRYRYPFINCTNCGPRYSIIRGVPYDRPGTTMARFTMCPECRAEYEDPGNRRFHAQPNACPVCGPSIRLVDARGRGIAEDGRVIADDGRAIAGDALKACADRLRAGEIVAVKGLGGFHLACRADSDEAVGRLRKRKNREAKPFAVMVADLAAAGAIAEIGGDAAAALLEPARPIVLVPKRAGAAVSALVAPNSRTFGIMLPYTPLHALLLADHKGPLVMTSGNPAEEPLCRDNGEALERLAAIADAFLLHDRDIERPIDDSVVLVAPWPGGTDTEAAATGSTERSALLPLRRARGFVPDPVFVSPAAPVPVLAVGGELKSAVCILSGTRAVLSEHLGELSNPAAYRNFTRAVERLQDLLRVKPAIAACDMHPDYAATRFARSLGLPVTEVQHHHAHIVSCMAENNVSGPVIGISCDGTGYGTDGSVWGCEVLVCDAADFSRAGHLDTFPLPGGDAAARDTWRPAAGLLHAAFGSGWTGEAAVCFAGVDPEAAALAARRLDGPAPGPLTSSLGRLFDAAAFILGLCARNRYEAEAPMAMEAAAWDCPSETALLPYALAGGEGGAPLRIDVRPMIRALLESRRKARTAAESARAFHVTMAAALAECAARTAERTGIRTVALSGGCFANRFLLQRLASDLQRAKMDVITHCQVPPGDGGIALGQALAAAARKMKGLL